MPRELPTGLYLFLFFVLLAANVSLYRAMLAPDVLQISVLEVGPPSGGGSAVLLRTPSGETLLVDAGPDASVLRALGGKLPPWRRELDAVLLTSSAPPRAGRRPAR